MKLKKLKVCKVALVGDYESKKNLIISRYISGCFESDFSFTNGAGYASKIITFDDNNELSLDIWDTTSSEKYRGLNKLFFKDASVVILVYNITIRKTFESLKNYYYPLIQQNCPKNIILAVAANEVHLYENEEICENEGRAFADSIGAYFESVSAKHNTGIPELFMTVVKNYSELKLYDQQGRWKY